MTEPPSTPPGATADSLFASYRERLRAGVAPPRAEFLAAQPPELRAELARLFADFDALAAGAAGAAAPVAGMVLDDFRLVRELGEGGMGTVWLAEQLSLKRPVALKLLHPQFGRSPLVLDRFRREAEAGARLTHPGIVQVHAVGAGGGVHFLAQEFVPGGSLADLIVRHRDRRAASPADHRATAELFRKIALALEHAHRHGVIHRDLKPANILLTADGEPKVADFGLAKLDDELGLSRTGDFAGTPFYMSPEQAAARRMGLDLRTDVFSFGATLYEALTLVRAFDGDTSQQVIHKILTEDPLDPRRIRSQVPRGLAVICMKCLEKNPDRRYPTMAAAAEDLRRWLAHEPLRAKPPGPIARLRKWSRRHPVLAMGIATGSVALAVVTRLLMEVRDERDGAEAATSAARREARTAEETIDFLIGLFDESDPARTPGVELTAREILQRGAARVQAELREEPAVRARLLGAIGQVAWTLGDYAQAEPLLREALAESRRLHGEDHAETLASLGRLGLLCLDQDRLAEAEELLAAALAGGLAAAEPDRGAILTQQSNLAVCLQAQRRFPEAESLLLAVLAGDREAHGSDHPLTLTSLNNLADLYRVWGRLDEAEPWMREALERSERVRGPDDPSTLSTRDGLGVLLLLQGRSAEAEPLIEEALAGLQRVLPESHPDRLTSMYHLGLLRERQGRLEEATELWRAVYEGDERTFGPDHDYTLQAMERLARNLQARGLAGEAVELVRELVRRTPADAGGLAGRQGLLREVETAAAAAGEPSRPGGGER